MREADGRIECSVQRRRRDPGAEYDMLLSICDYSGARVERRTEGREVHKGERWGPWHRPHPYQGRTYEWTVVVLGRGGLISPRALALCPEVPRLRLGIYGGVQYGSRQFFTR